MIKNPEGIFLKMSATRSAIRCHCLPSCSFVTNMRHLLQKNCSPSLTSQGQIDVLWGSAAVSAGASGAAQAMCAALTPFICSFLYTFYILSQLLPRFLVSKVSPL